MFVEVFSWRFMKKKKVGLALAALSNECKLKFVVDEFVSCVT